MMQTEFENLLKIFSTPRPNGSISIENAQKFVIDLLRTDYSWSLHTYTMYPHTGEILGIWFAVSHFLLLYSIFYQSIFWAFVIVIQLIVILLLELSGNFTITRISQCVGKNIIIDFPSFKKPNEHVILSAHYDSKTEFFPIGLRKLFYNYLPIGLFLFGPALCIVFVFIPKEDFLFGFFYVLLCVHSILMAGFGLNNLLGRFAKPSHGCVDNGGSCIALLDLASQFSRLNHTRVTIILFSGEELFVQGSRAFAQDYKLEMPHMLAVKAINCEGLGQDGDYFLTKFVGTPLGKYECDAVLNRQLTESIEKEANANVIIESSPFVTDSLPFLEIGIPATTLGTYDTHLRLSGLHTSADNSKRITSRKIQEASTILLNWLSLSDKECSEE